MGYLRTQMVLLKAENQKLERRCIKLEQTLKHKQSQRKGPQSAQTFAAQVVRYSRILRQAYIRELVKVLDSSDLTIMETELWQRDLISLDKIKQHLQQLSNKQLAPFFSLFNNNYFVNLSISKLTLEEALRIKYPDSDQNKAKIWKELVDVLVFNSTISINGILNSDYWKSLWSAFRYKHKQLFTWISSMLVQIGGIGFKRISKELQPIFHPLDSLLGTHFLDCSSSIQRTLITARNQLEQQLSIQQKITERGPVVFVNATKFHEWLFSHQDVWNTFRSVLPKRILLEKRFVDGYGFFRFSTNSNGQTSIQTGLLNYLPLANSIKSVFPMARWFGDDTNQDFGNFGQFSMESMNQLEQNGFKGPDGIQIQVKYVDVLDGKSRRELTGKCTAASLFPLPESPVFATQLNDMTLLPQIVSTANRTNDTADRWKSGLLMPNRVQNAQNQREMTHITLGESGNYNQFNKDLIEMYPGLGHMLELRVDDHLAKRLIQAAFMIELEMGNKLVQQFKELNISYLFGNKNSTFVPKMTTAGTKRLGETAIFLAQQFPYTMRHSIVRLFDRWKEVKILAKSDTITGKEFGWKIRLFGMAFVATLGEVMPPSGAQAIFFLPSYIDHILALGEEAGIPLKLKHIYEWVFESAHQQAKQVSVNGSIAAAATVGNQLKRDTLCQQMNGQYSAIERRLNREGYSKESMKTKQSNEIEHLIDVEYEEEMETITEQLETLTLVQPILSGCHSKVESLSVNLYEAAQKGFLTALSPETINFETAAKMAPMLQRPKPTKWTLESVGLGSWKQNTCQLVIYWKDERNQFCIDLNEDDGFNYRLAIPFIIIVGMEIQQHNGMVELKIKVGSFPQQFCKYRKKATIKSKGLKEGDRVWKLSPKDITNGQITKNRVYNLVTKKAINIEEWKTQVSTLEPQLKQALINGVVVDLTKEDVFVPKIQLSIEHPKHLLPFIKDPELVEAFHHALDRIEEEGFNNTTTRYNLDWLIRQYQGLLRQFNDLLYERACKDAFDKEVQLMVKEEPGIKNNLESVKEMDQITTTIPDWIQCDGCGKWRRLPQSVDTTQFGETWICVQNSWDTYKTCLIGQEKSDEEIDLEIQEGKDAAKKIQEEPQHKKKKK